MVGVKVAAKVAAKGVATPHARTAVVKIAKDVMAPGRSLVIQPVRALARVAVADAADAVVGAAPGGIAQIALHRARWAQVKDRAQASNASALTQKANPSHWTLPPQLA